MKTFLFLSLLALAGCAYAPAATEQDAAFGQYVFPASECIGAVVAGVCHGSPKPGEQIRMRTGQTPKCYGTMIGGQCTGPQF